MTARPLLLRCASFALLALVAACAAPQKRPDVVWPEPPEVPRIKFVKALRSAEDLDSSGWSRFTRKLVGEGKEEGLHVIQPMGLAISEDGKRIYVADYQGSAVLVFDLEKKQLSRFAEQEGITYPFNVALDADENVYVTEPTTKQVRVFTRGGKRLRAFGQTDLERPTGLVIDRGRRLLYVADSARVDSDKHRVLVYSLDGQRVREVGNGRGSEEGQFNFPGYLALDEAGSLFVADAMNFRLQVFDADGKFVRAYGQAGTGLGSFARIKGLDFDGFGNLYVADGEHSVVQLFNREFQPLMFFGGFAPKLEYFDIPSCVAVDRKINRIYVCNEDFGRLNVYDLVNTSATDSAVQPEAPTAAPAEPGTTSAPAPGAPPTK